MALEVPSAVTDVLAKFEERTDAFLARELRGALESAVPNRAELSAEKRKGLWAEAAAFAFDVREAPGGGPWGTHFQPWMSGENQDGTPFYVPDLRDADAEVVSHWAARAESAKHPVLVARYADLVWDATKFVTKGKPGIDSAWRAIDAYVAASRLDKGSAWGDTHRNLGRALQLALSTGDDARVSAAVAANFEYVERTGNDERIGTYCYLFRHLLPPEKGPALSEEQEGKLVGMFEGKFAAMIAPGSRWYAEPHGPQSVGNLLAAYYARKNRPNDRVRILRGIAETLERRAKAGDPVAGLLFLDSARRTYLEAGLRPEAERVQRESQEIGPEAAKSMTPITAESEVKNDDLEGYLSAMMDGGLEKALSRFAFHFVPKQSEIAEHLKDRDAQFIAHKIFPMTKLAHGHIVAHVGDDTADPDGELVHETATHMQFASPWIGWTLERMVREGLAAARVMELIRKTPIFEEDRLGLVERGVEAHLRGDYVQAIHVLVPQIEHAVRMVAYLVGKPSNKAHRTGRGVMQFKNLNDLLPKDQWLVPGEGGEDLRMYLLAALAHPKGLNIRNDVSHGVWSERVYGKTVSERVFHVLMAVASIRLGRTTESNTDVQGAVGPAAPETPKGDQSAPPAVEST